MAATSTLSAAGPSLLRGRPGASVGSATRPAETVIISVSTTGKNTCAFDPGFTYGSRCASHRTRPSRRAGRPVMRAAAAAAGGPSSSSSSASPGRSSSGSSAPGKFRSAPRTVADLELTIDAPGWSGGYGTGGKVWSASAVLTRWLVDHAETLGLAGSSVVELGSGTGAVGIAAAALGASTVVLSDGGSQSLIRLAKDNAAKNIRAGAIDGEVTAVHTVQYAWGKGPLPRVMAAAAPYDLVVGSDCTYSVGGHGALCDSIAELLAHSARVAEELADAGERDERDAAGRGGTSRHPSRHPTGAGGSPRVILGHQHRTLAAALAGRGSAGWGRDPHLAMFAAAAKSRGLVVTELLTESLAWHGLRNVSVLEVSLEPRDVQERQKEEGSGREENAIPPRT